MTLIYNLRRYESRAPDLPFHSREGGFILAVDLWEVNGRRLVKPVVVMIILLIAYAGTRSSGSVLGSHLEAQDGIGLKGAGG
jgi:hypothetical protein